jgi:lysophospholipase L1-like esterase/signal recognition particle subunit SEC65
LTKPPAARPSWRVRIVFLVLCVGLLAGVLEGGARLWYTVRGRLSRRSHPAAAAAPRPAPSAAEIEEAGRALDLDPYEIADLSQPRHWRLRAGYRATVREVLDAKRREGRVLAVRYIEKRAPELGIAPDDVAISINDDGFRGPPLDPTHARLRILSLGDSCTFGTFLSQDFGYPRALERELSRRGVAVEAINAGVEAYAPRNVLLRLDEFRALRPEITTVYLGWNALWGERYLEEAAGAGRALRSFRLFGEAYERARQTFGDQNRQALEDYARPKHPDRNAREVRLLDAFTPSFLPDMMAIIEGMQASGSRVVLLTLPGLYAMDEDPSPRALEIGHLPTFTDNPFVLARMADRYNEVLRGLARERGCDLVDLAAWSREALRPRDAQFLDSVHLVELAQQKLGIHLADALEPMLPASARHGPTPSR